MHRIVATSLYALWLIFGLATSASAQVTGGISTTLTAPGAATRSFLGRLEDATYATDFCTGSQITGGADATACLQNSINALCNKPQPGGQLYIPAGQYQVVGTVNINCAGIKIEGAGIGDRCIAPANSGDVSPTDGNACYSLSPPGGVGTMIIAKGSGGSAPVFKASVTKYTNVNGTGQATPANSSFAYGFSIRNLMIMNNRTDSLRTGPFIEIERFQQAYVDHVYFWNPCTAVKINGGFNIHVSDYVAEGYSNCSVMLVIGGTGTYTTDVVYFNNGKVNAGIQNSNAACFEIRDRVQSVYWTNTQCETSSFALKSSCPTMANALNCPGFFVLNDFEAEAFPSVGNEVLISLTDTVDGFKMIDSWLRGCNGPFCINTIISIEESRFPATPNCRDFTVCAGNLMVNITDSWLKFAGGDCINVRSSRTQISGNQIYGCNFYNGGRSGINILASRATIVGNQLCGGDWLNEITWQMAGIKINAGVDYVAITGNVYNGNTNPTSGSPVLASNACSTGLVNFSAGTRISSTGNVGP